MWETSGAEVVREATRTQLSMTYIGRRQGNHGTLGGITTDIQSVCRGEGLQGGRAQEGGLVAPRGDRETTLGYLSRSLVGR